MCFLNFKFISKLVGTVGNIHIRAFWHGKLSSSKRLKNNRRSLWCEKFWYLVCTEGLLYR